MATKQGVNKMNRRLRRTGLAFYAVFVLSASGGCTQTILPGYLLSFGAGWLFGQSTVSTTTECFLNGEPIDCDSVP